MLKNKVLNKYTVIASLSSVLYHKTEETRAISILKEDMFRLSTWLGTHTDKSKEEQLWFFSTSTRHNAYRPGSSGVVFVLDGLKLGKDYAGSPFDYWGEEWHEAAKKVGREGAHDEAEERVYSDTPTIPKASKYIKEIHAEWWMPGNDYDANAYQRHRSLTLLAKKLGIPIFWYEDTGKILDKKEAKNFSDFPKGPAMKAEDLQSRLLHSGISAYRTKEWLALLSIEPAKKRSDIPKDAWRHLSRSSDGHGSFEAYIHNATKNMLKDEMRYVYKLQKQMTRTGSKTVKEFYWKMLDKLLKLEKESSG